MPLKKPQKTTFESTSQKKLADLEFDEIRSYLENFESRYAPENDQTLEDLVSSVKNTLSNITNADHIQLKDRLHALEQIRANTVASTQKISPAIPEIAPILWKQRGKENRGMSPCDFLATNYPSYGFGLSWPDIRRLDINLYNALRNYKLQKGFPDGFFLPTKKQKNDLLLDSLGHETVSKAERLAKALKARKK